MIHLYDGNNWVRRILERDTTGLAPRTIMMEIAPQDGAVVFVWDGARANARRRKLFPNYKLNRQPLKKDIYVGFDMIADVLKFTKAIQVKVPDYEADDVVASLALHYAQNGEQIAIHSNDMDFLQLGERFPKSIFCGAAPKVEHRLVRYYKVTVGDPSDNIPGVLGFGQLTWESVDKDQLIAWVDALVADSTLPEIDLPKRCLSWISLPENRELVRTFWEIVGFYDVPISVISQHTTVGQPNFAAADAYLKEFFL